MSKIALPTLSTDSFLEDSSIIMVKLLLYYLTTSQYQSNLFKTQIRSFRYDMLHSDNNPSIKKERIKSSLEDIYNNYFKEVRVQVDIDEAKTFENRVYFILRIETEDHKGKTYDLHREFYSNYGDIVDLDQIVLGLTNVYLKGVKE